MYVDVVSDARTALQKTFADVVYMSVKTNVWAVDALATVGIFVMTTLKFEDGTWSVYM